jgi:hypothetical protein
MSTVDRRVCVFRAIQGTETEASHLPLVDPMVFGISLTGGWFKIIRSGSMGKRKDIVMEEGLVSNMWSNIGELESYYAMNGVVKVGDVVHKGDQACLIWWPLSCVRTVSSASVLRPRDIQREPTRHERACRKSRRLLSLRNMGRNLVRDGIIESLITVCLDSRGNITYMGDGGVPYDAMKWLRNIANMLRGDYVSEPLTAADRELMRIYLKAFTRVNSSSEDTTEDKQ